MAQNNEGPPTPSRVINILIGRPRTLKTMCVEGRGGGEKARPI